MKRQFMGVLIAVMTVTGSLVACDGGSKSGGGANPVNPVGTCLPGTPCVPGPVNPYNSKSWTGNLVILDHGRLRAMLKDNGVCDYLPFGNFLNLDCNSWDNQASLQFELFGTSVPAQSKATIISYSQYGQAYLPYSGTTYPTENNTKIELRTTGFGTGYNKIFQAIGTPTVTPVPLTSMGSVQQMRIEILYDGGQVGYSDVFLRW